jgi:hypothetical protein
VKRLDAGAVHEDAGRRRAKHNRTGHKALCAMTVADQHAVPALHHYAVNILRQQDANRILRADECRMRQDQHQH